MSPRSRAVGVGVIGAGVISDQYLTNLARYPDVAVRAVGDRDVARAETQATRYDVPRAGDAATVLDDRSVEIIVNLTHPAAHVKVSSEALRAGKHVWSEKPIGIDRVSARGLLELAAARGLLLGVAPDTVLGPLWQTAKRAIDSGAIGTPTTAVTAFQYQGPEVFHPHPEFLYARGAGPLFDMGPYYFSALVHLLGPVTDVRAVGRTSEPTRRIRVGPDAGTEFPVEVPTHVMVASAFAAGASAASLLSFESPLSRQGIFEINGTEATIAVGDPNGFGGGPLRIYRRWEVEPADGLQTPELLDEVGPVPGRGVGAVTMARAIRGDGRHIATGELAYHVLDVLASVEEAIGYGTAVTVESSVEPVPSMPVDFDPFSASS